MRTTIVLQPMGTKCLETALTQMAETILRAFRAGSVAPQFHFMSYHGFGKATLDPEWVSSILPAELSIEDVQIDVISVKGDLSHQVHYHEHALAHLVILGPAEGAPAPKSAEAFLGSNWKQITSGSILLVRPGTAHGFRAAVDDEFWFLSLQCPPILRQGGDDYFVVPQGANP